MASPTYTIRPALRCLRRAQALGSGHIALSRSFGATTSRNVEATVETTTSSNPPNPPMELDPNTVSTRGEERLLLQTRGLHPIGSRRRRAALKSSDQVPFEQMPYQCFQEARKVLQQDRDEKLVQITEMRRRIARWQNMPAEECGGEYAKKGKLVRMQKHLEGLKILADINDPMIKKRFEDGIGDMNRPIYRHLADKKWREYKRLILMQRITQMHIVPDILAYVDPTAEVTLAFGRHTVQPGEFVDSRVSERPARLKIQTFDKGERLVSIAVMDSDVPDEEKDSFGSRCHFLAVNIPISPTSTSVPLSKLDKDSHIIYPWLPPYAEKGAPYHRLAVFVLQQGKEVGIDEKVDVESLRKEFVCRREQFSFRRFVQGRKMHPIGMHLFRSIWDEGTDGVVQRAGIEGFNVEFIRKKPEKGLYKKKDGARYR